VLDRPWVRLVIGALAAALLGAMAARVAVSAGDGAGAPGAGGSSLAGGGRGGPGGGPSSSAGGSGPGEDSTGGASATLAGGSGKVTVHVTGEVRRPGVYALREGSRVDDAVRRAGGATGDGDRQGLNLAAAVRDGQQVRVPPKAAPAAAGGGSSGGAGGASAAAGGAKGDAAAGGAPVDLNTATLEELQTLDGVGPTTAEKIIELRDERGGLSGVDDLDEIPGIGAKKLEALRAQLEP
jgi:competence protein ComEA